MVISFYQLGCGNVWSSDKAEETVGGQPLSSILVCFSSGFGNRTFLWHLALVAHAAGISQ